MRRGTVPSRGSRSLAAAGALATLVVAESLWLGLELRAPWSGLALASAAASLLVLGYVAGLRGVLLAAVATAIVVVVRFPPWHDEPVTDRSGCDPSCGLSTTGFLILVLPVVAIAAAAGTGLRRSRSRRTP